jgi:hypothetical protein
MHDATRAYLAEFLELAQVVDAICDPKLFEAEADRRHVRRDLPEWQGSTGPRND